MAETILSETVPIDDRAKSYLWSGDIVASIASEHFGVEFDQLTRRRCQEVMGLLREVDTLADDTDATHAEVLESLATFTQFEPRYPHLSPGALGHDVHTTMLNRTAYILKVGRHASEATSRWRFSALRALEGRESVKLFGDCASPSVTEQPAFCREFLPRLGALAASATLADSLIDARADFKAGKQRLQPDAEFYRAVAGGMLHHARGNLRCLMHAGPVYFGARKVIARVENRLRNGVPSYSNLYRFRRHRTN